MKKILLFLSSVLALSIATKANQQQQEIHNSLPQNCQDPSSPLSGLTELGVGVDLLKLDTKNSVFEFSCSQHKLSLDGQNQILDGVEVDLLFQLNQQQKTLMAQNAQQYENFKLSTFNTNLDTKLCPEYSFKLAVVAGALNPNNKQIEKTLNAGNSIYQIMSSKYKTYRAKIIDYSKLTLNQQFITELAALPKIYNMKTHITFLEKFGTHFREGIILGGLISQVGYTQTAYTQNGDADLSDVSTNFDNYYAQQLLSENLSVNHLPNQLLSPNVDTDYQTQTNFKPLHIGGGSHQTNSLQGWIATLYDKPVVVEQRLVNITSLITPELLPKSMQNDIPQLRTNVNQALKDYLINSSGCTNPKAINYDPNARIADNSCYFSAFYGSYQTCSGNCATTFSDKYTLPNPITQDTTCPSGSEPKQVGIYTLDNCDLKQYFCMRTGVPSNKDDLQKSLQICQARSLTNAFYENTEQYQCNEAEQELYFNIKYDARKVIYTCTQYWCFQKESEGTENFFNQHQGSCKGYNVHTDKETNDVQSCQGACLIQYGLVKLGDDCDLHQYICVKNQFDIQCVNSNY